MASRVRASQRLLVCWTGVYEIDSGSVTIDGHELSALDTTWLRGQVMAFINQ